MLLERKLALALTAVAALILPGCTGGNSDYAEVDPNESEVAHGDHGHHDHGDHDHGHHGPNGGDIVELGNEEFHAEFVVDELANRIDVFILGSDAKTAKPIEATELSLSFKHDDEVEEFKLTAVEQDGEPDGHASLFTLTSDEVVDELHEHTEGATLSFTAEEQTLTGAVTHDHDHDHDHGHGHGHGHGDHDHGDHDHDEHKEGDEDHGDEAPKAEVKPAAE